MSKPPAAHLDSTLISQLAEAMIDAKNLESLVRPLFSALAICYGAGLHLFYSNRSARKHANGDVCAKHPRA